MRLTSLLLVSVIAAAAATHGATKARATTTSVSPSAVADIRAHWRIQSGYVLQSAMDVPEDKYGYKPTSAVRSFGELFAHVAGSQAMFCAIALGEPAPAEDAVKATSKAALIEALKQSNAYCDRAYAQTDAAAMAMVDVFGEQHTRLYALMMNATHDGEHYGNLITYLRMNGMVPPSSRPM
ncbi:MAG: DinB family protein [bacterium]